MATQLSEHGLKVTPQRIAVLKAVRKSSDHPSAEEIYREVVRSIPGMSQTTVYNTLDTFVEKGIINKVHTGSDVNRYDGVTGDHHHLYGENSDRVEDFFDPELDRLLEEYFKNRRIEGFTVNRIQLQVVGTFENSTEKQQKKRNI
jgi:Fur family peroxide stress response transcriptional regulator